MIDVLYCIDRKNPACHSTANRKKVQMSQTLHQQMNVASQELWTELSYQYRVLKLSVALRVGLYTG